MDGTASVGVRLQTTLDRVLEPEGAERFARRALGVAVLAYAALALWLTRGASFTFEEWIYIGESHGFAPDSIAEPFGGHLIAVTRLFFEASLSLFGPAHLPFQLFVIALAAAAAVLLFALVKRRVGALAALAPAILLLFLGSTPEVLNGWTTMWVQASVAGLAAFLALDRRSRRGDALACILLIAAILSFSVGVAFAIGAGAWILAERDRRRIWVAVVPLALYGAWWLWALKFDQGFQSTTNALLTPVWAADSLAAAAAALTGLGVDLTRGPDLYSVAVGWGRVIAAVGVAVAVVGLRRRGSSPLLWGAVGLLLALWFAEGLSYSGAPLARRTPDLDRYAYPVAIGVVLVLAASFRGSTPSRRALLVIFGLVALALPVNLWEMRERGGAIRTESDLARARLSAIELEREVVPKDFIAIVPFEGKHQTCRLTLVCGGLVPSLAGDYLAAVDRFGGFGYSVEALEAASPDTRKAADETLVGIVMPTITAIDGRKWKCAGGGSEVELAPGGAVLRAEGGGTVSLRRFADEPTIEAGTLAPGQAGRIELPVDAAAQPWVASVSSGKLEVCEVDS